MRKRLVRLAPLGALLALWPMSALAAGWLLTSQPQIVIPEPGNGSMVLAGVLGVIAVMRRRLGS